MPHPQIFMCPPEHFEVSYVINPWMTPDDWQEHRADYTALSAAGWDELKATLEKLGAEIDLMAPAPGLPDLVFTANAAVVMDGKALVATFKNNERQGEEPLYFAYFQNLQKQGRLSKVEMTPPDMILEGAGDCVWDEQRNLFWMGYGQRSDKEAQPIIEEFFDLEVLAVELVNPFYYHMDTALVPLTGGEIVYHPGAFSPEGLRLIESQAGKENLIAVPEEDAARLSVNLVNIDKNIVLCAASDAMRGMLNERGYTLHQLPISHFSKSGGSAFCLTLRLDRASRR